MKARRPTKTRFSTVEDFDVSISERDGKTSLVFSNYDFKGLKRRVTIDLSRFDAASMARAVLRNTREWAKRALADAERSP